MAASQEIPELNNIREALQVSYDARASGHARQDALKYLDELKSRPDAPQYGYFIAHNPSELAQVRQFGLSLLEHAVKYNWLRHTQEQSDTIRDWIITLSRGLSTNDTPYYRNKLAWLWAQLAKRSWAASWLDMDRYLDTFWHTNSETDSVISRHFVLDVLEILSEDICVRDEPIAMLRQEALGQALNEIMVPQTVYNAHLESRGTAHQVRMTDQGWFAIMCQSLSDLLDAPSSNTVNLVVKLLRAIRPTVSWISLQTMIDTDCVMSLYKAISVGDIQIQTAAVECLFDIASRPYLPHLHDQWMNVMHPQLQVYSIQVLRQCYSTSIVSGRVIDDAKYTLAKKISEVLSLIGDATTRHPDLRSDSDQMAQFYDLLITLFKSESLSISLPVLHALCRTLQSGTAMAAALDPAVSVLLGVCSQRLIRYEALPEDSDAEAVLFLQEDYETLPEQHAFLGNYRRYCNSVISHISQRRPLEALQHILGETLNVLKDAALLDASSFTKSCSQVLRLQAQHSVVRSALNGYLGWASKAKRAEDELDPEAKMTMNTVASNLQQWCRELMQISATRPDVACLSIQLLVEVASKIQDIDRDFVQALFLWILDVRINRDRSDLSYKDAIKTFLSAWLAELQRLATAYPNYLYPLYVDLEQKIGHISTEVYHDSRTQWGLRTVLVILCHRAFALDENTRYERLQHMTQGISTAWQDERLIQGLSSPAAFLALIGFGDLVRYLSSSPFERNQDWSSQPLDQPAKSIVAGSEKHIEDLPLRMTASILAATTDRLTEGSAAQEIARALWTPLIPMILPSLIKMLKLATGFADPANWQDMSPDKQRAIEGMFADRFWQSGISNESKDEFTTRISRSGDTFEGFASTVRGAPRQIRDSCYQIIHKLVRFTNAFFDIEELPQPLADGILGQAQCLSVHHLQRTISLVERLTNKCPPSHLRKFLPPLLALTFSQMDGKITGEWARIDKARTGESASADDSLNGEMQAESVVRTTTFAVVNLVASLLEIRRPSSHRANGHDSPATLRQIVLTELTILEPLIVFCTHALGMRDSRCCGLTARTLVSILPTYAPSTSTPSPTSQTSDPWPPPQVREFICSHILKAAITSLNEPYFVDCQRDLAALITGILIQYAPHSDTPRQILLSLPDMHDDRVDSAIARVLHCRASERKAMAVVLELLESVRGVSIAEAGKIQTSLAFNGSATGAQHDAKRNKVWLHSGLTARQPGASSGMDVEGAGHAREGVSPGLEGVGEMFGNDTS